MLGNLHYYYAEEMDEAERVALGARGAAVVVIQEIKALRKAAIKERRRRRGTPTTSSASSAGIVVSHTKAELLGPRVTNQEAFQWYMAAAEAGHTGVS